MAQHQRRDEEADGIERDRERRAQQLDQSAGEARPDERRRRLAERDLRVRLDQPLASCELRKQHLVRRAADDILHAAEEADDEQHVDRKRAEPRGDRHGEQRDAARDVGDDDDGKLAHAVEHHAGVQRHERERQRLERDEHAHLHRRRVQQQRRGKRQREVRDLRAERGDGQRSPQLAEIVRNPQAAKAVADRSSKLCCHDGAYRCMRRKKIGAPHEAAKAARRAGVAGETAVAGTRLAPGGCCRPGD